MYLSEGDKGFLVCPTLSVVIQPSTVFMRQPVARRPLLARDSVMLLTVAHEMEMRLISVSLEKPR